jgi:hypothetical protein
MTEKRKIVARGLTSADHGKNIVFRGQEVLLRHVQPFTKTVVLTYVTSIEVPWDEIVEVY